MDTFTISEAAERCGVTVTAMRKRVDRGTIQSSKVDGVRHIPQSELVRAGLWPGSVPGEAERTELMSLRQELADAQQELVALRPLRAQLDAERQSHELTERSLMQERATTTEAVARRTEAEQQLTSAEQDRDQALHQRDEALQPLLDGGFLAGFRAFRTLRANRRHATTPSA